MKNRVPKLQAGDKAPNFKTLNQDGKEVCLSDFKGKKVALYFYPKDMTSGCTAQACDLRDNYASLKKKGWVILGVSNDDVKSHLKFAGKYELPFDLLADTDKEIVKAYDVYGEKSMYGRKYMGIYRTTFLIDEKGKIERVISDVETKTHHLQILGS